MSGYGLFLRGLLQHPRDVSAPTPSSSALAAAIAAEVDPGVPGLIVELGAGSGAVTEALLARVDPRRLVAIETGEYFAALLRKRFSSILVIQGDALNLESYLPPGNAISAVVSGLPLLNFSPEARRRLIEKALQIQGPNGRFIQLSYGWRPAVPSGDFRIENTIIWRNFPPAHIWTYRTES
jgi:phosphatidylethanolamine/phosphatidyl-N-methylethanolamine N-methyltransferase